MCRSNSVVHVQDYKLPGFVKVFYVLLNVHPGMILVNNQLDAQFFMYVYFCSLHVSGSHVPNHHENYCINTKPGLCHSV